MTKRFSNNPGWNDEENAILARYYPEMGARRLYASGHIPGRSEMAIKSQAREMGVRCLWRGQGCTLPAPDVSVAINQWAGPVDKRPMVPVIVPEIREAA